MICLVTAVPQPIRNIDQELIALISVAVHCSRVVVSDICINNA